MKKKREMGLLNIVMLGLSGAIGFEVFVLLDYAYFHLAGPNIIWALLFAGVVNLLIMLSYCELSAAMPEVGGEYTYIKTAYGGYVAFISGCFRWLASVFMAALAAVTFTIQFAFLLAIIAPEAQSLILTQIPLISVLVIVAFGALEIRGTKRLGSVIVVALIALFLVFIVGGLIYGLGPIELPTEPTLENFSGVLAATGYVFPMFFGVRAIVASASLTKKPGRNLPKGILLSALLIVPLYICIAYVAVGVVAPEEIQMSVPLLSYAAGKIMGVSGWILFSIAGMVASISALGTSLTVQSSIARGMSRDGYLPKILLKVHPRLGTYHVAIISGSFFVMLLSATGVVPFLGYAASFGALLVFAVVNLSLLKLRRDKPNMERPFKTPGYPVTPFAGILLSIALLVFPLLIGDVNAIDALISGIGLTALVVLTYYLRMVGRYRTKIALGGINLGVGISLAVLLLLVEMGVVELVFLSLPSYILLFFSLVFLIAGVLHVTTSSRGRKKRIN
ncbi:amino acid permease [Candidatus Bathyarchaeota archaeon]|nr:amino acid permease [Candidatus Bathyarchaeota archaeon]